MLVIESRQSRQNTSSTTICMTSGTGSLAQTKTGIRFFDAHADGNGLRRCCRTGDRICTEVDYEHEHRFTEHEHEEEPEQNVADEGLGQPCLTHVASTLGLADRPRYPSPTNFER